MKVLVVDDSQINLRVAQKLLEFEGLNVDTVLSGTECLEKVKTEKYDIIFMDIMMPEMDGVETFKKLQEQKDFNIPVVCVTADAETGSRDKYLSDGCIVNYNQISISGLNEVKREIKKRSGFFDSKLKKIKFHNNVMGYLKNDVSDVCLKIEFTDEHHKTTKYLLYFQFNKNSLIEKINIELFDERIPMKMIIDDDLEKLLNSKYNDYNI